MTPLCSAGPRKEDLGWIVRVCETVAEKYRSVLLLGIVLILCANAFAQVETATVSGLVTDQSGAVIVGAEVQVTNADTNINSRGTSNSSGIYLVTGLKPGRYRIHVAKDGFKSIDLTDLTLNVQDSVSRNFALHVGSTSESVTVDGSALQINTQDATVSTVVDRQFAENLPLNGRSFQTLIQLTPGVVTVTTNDFSSGQFSVNGQRASSNYWMVDGVSANVGIGASSTGPLEGSIGSFNVLGGTNSLVSVDALQEFRLETSTYAPEFGRSPGGQISIVTRSGTNNFHGSAFDYFRNDVLDASDWFANSVGLPRPEERQNDFGGTVSGPVARERTFFFFSYEGLRLRLPTVGLTTVPDIAARQSASAAIQPYLNAFPIPNGPEDPMNPGAAQFNASYSNPGTLDAYSIRLDHRLNGKLALFGRYNYSPSETSQRPLALSAVTSSRITVQTATIGATLSSSPAVANDLRFNFSRTEANSHGTLDAFGGAVPLSTLSFPSPYTVSDANLAFIVLQALKSGGISVGKLSSNLQRQYNVVDTLALQNGPHSLKFGVDYRRLSPVSNPSSYAQEALFLDLPSAESGNPFLAQVTSQNRFHFLFQNLSLFAQDTWRLSSRFTVTYGLRWDVDFALSSSPLNIPAVTGFNLNDLSQLALAPAGTPAFKTPYGNVAPRVGMAYQLSQRQDWTTVLRGGFGVFYDLADGEVNSFLASSTSYPYGAIRSCPAGVQLPGCPATLVFPLDPTTAAPPSITPNTPNNGILTAFDPNLSLPYTLEWSLALEQGLGKQQSLSATYIGASGRRLIQPGLVNQPNPSVFQAYLVTNLGTSEYNGLQLQFQRRLTGGLQALASYSWSHSIDTGSANSLFGTGSNGFVPGLNTSLNRGPSDFDIRNAFSGGVTYAIPSLRTNPVIKAVLRDWSLESIVQARSAPPVDLTDSTFQTVLNGQAQVRPDVVPGIPLYLFGPQYPGGKAINNTPGAVAGGCSDGSQSIGPFCPPPTDAGGNPIRQGNLGRNALRGFGATQWDFAVHRDFPIHETLRLQFRAEMFNVLNHPNFGPPEGDISNANFGQSIHMLGQSLAGGSTGNGGFSPLYQIGGPRSIQLALKLMF